MSKQPKLPKEHKKRLTENGYKWDDHNSGFIRDLLKNGDLDAYLQAHDNVEFASFRCKVTPEEHQPQYSAGVKIELREKHHTEPCRGGWFRVCSGLAWGTPWEALYDCLALLGVAEGRELKNLVGAKHTNPSDGAAPKDPRQWLQSQGFADYSSEFEFDWRKSTTIENPCGAPPNVAKCSTCLSVYGPGVAADDGPYQLVAVLSVDIHRTDNFRQKILVDPDLGKSYGTAIEAVEACVDAPRSCLPEWVLNIVTGK